MEEKELEELLESRMEDFLNLIAITERCENEFNAKTVKIREEKAQIDQQKKIIKEYMEGIELMEGKNTEKYKNAADELNKLDNQLADLNEQEENTLKERKQRKVNYTFSALAEKVLEEGSLVWCQTKLRKQKAKLRCMTCNNVSKDPQTFKQVCKEDLIECLGCIREEPKCYCCGVNKKSEVWEDGVEIRYTTSFFEKLIEKVKS